MGTAIVGNHCSRSSVLPVAPHRSRQLVDQLRPNGPPLASGWRFYTVEARNKGKSAVDQIAKKVAKTYLYQCTIFAKTLVI